MLFIPTPETTAQEALGLIAHIGAASVVTIHTLLRKRDVPVAIGWIGMAWLAPALGALLYFGFGINRVRRRARRLMGADARPTYAGRQNAPDDPLADLETAVGAVTRRTCCGGSRGGAFILRRRRLSGNAGGDRGRQGQRAACDLHLSRRRGRASRSSTRSSAAKRRGVKVTVLIDGFGGGFLRRAGLSAAAGMRASTRRCSCIRCCRGRWRS